MRSDEFEYAPKEFGDQRTPQPGLYKTKLSRFGDYIPVKVTQVCDRDEVGHLISDVEYMVMAWPRAHCSAPVKWKYEETSPFMREIDKDEFEWMITLKTL